MKQITSICSLFTSLLVCSKNAWFVGFSVGFCKACAICRYYYQWMWGCSCFSWANHACILHMAEADSLNCTLHQFYVALLVHESQKQYFCTSIVHFNCFFFLHLSCIMCKLILGGTNHSSHWRFSGVSDFVASLKVLWAITIFRAFILHSLFSLYF